MWNRISDSHSNSSERFFNFFSSREIDRETVLVDNRVL